MERPEEPEASSQAARLAELEAQVERLARDLESERERRHEAVATARARAADLERVRRDAERFQRRRSVRSATILAARARSLPDAFRRMVAWPGRAFRSVLRRIRERIDGRRRRASPGDERAVAERIRGALPPAPITGGRLVSIIIVNRNGREHLERCLRAVALTAYRNIEVLIVDNASSDGSAELAEGLAMPFPLKVIRNTDNRSFSEANNQGVAASAGPLICFLNNDVDPITEHWLGYMVETSQMSDVVAVGARLIYPRHRGGRRGGARFADLTLQHRGVGFDRSSAVPLPKVMGAGEDPMSADAGAIAERQALTAACLLVRRIAFDAVGGFSTAYEYGLEDVDLCLKLRAAGGRLIYDGRAALWHHESATRATDGRLYRARVERNREAYLDAWGPRILREVLLDALEGRAAFSEQPYHVAIAITSLDPAAGYGDWYTGHELGDALGEFGWRVSYVERAGDGWYRPDPSVGAVIVLLDACDIRRMPAGLLRVGWVRNWPDRWLGRPWFDEYDIVLASSGWIVDRIAERSAKTATLLPLATNPTRFRSEGPKPDSTSDVLFVGNYWGQERDVVAALPALAARGLTVDVYGRGWEAVPEFGPLHRGFLAYDDIPRAYASARIVVDDAAEPTRVCGSVNSRVFDALAMGAIVVTSGAPGVHALFGDAFPTWSDETSLIALVESILADPQPYVESARRYRAEVLKGHTYGLRAAAVRDRLMAWASTTRYTLRIGAPSWDVADAWGDYHFARSLQRALERAGHPARIHVVSEWADATAARSDVTVHLFGLTEAPTRPGQVNLLWHISHPDLATPKLYDRYDGVFVASDSFAERMAARASVPVTALHQATDPERFKPEPTGPRHELLFVANSRSVRRRIVDDLAGTKHDLAVYGRNWRPDLIDPRHVRGEGIPNADLARYYSSAAIVLNDHWEDMRAEGFISNRIYDALACGAFVISDDVDGIAEEFDGAVATYSERADLLTLVEHYLANPEERRLLGERGRAVVVARHTFAARVREIEGAAAGLLRERPSRILPPPAG